GAVHSSLLCSLQQYLHVLFIITVCSVTFSVSTDRNITAQVGDPVTLPCYANVGKQANLSHLNIRWEKDGQTVLDIQSGTGSGFKNRVSFMIRISDRGAYQCFFKDNKGTPDGIILSVAGRICFKSSILPSIYPSIHPSIHLFILNNHQSITGQSHTLTTTYTH
uniref:Ig-like domain-containing protein n=1 Tax=Scleropages formosus TaxID=113540 RepID=A0A8C9WL98_SCLFO